MQRTATICLVILTTIAISVMLFQTRSIMVPFVLAVFFSFMLGPAVSFFETKFKMPRWLSLLIVLLIVSALLFAIVLVAAGTVSQALANAGDYQETLQAFTAHVIDRLHVWGLDPETVNKDELIARVRAVPFFSYFSSAAGSAFSFIVNAGLILIFVIFMLAGSGEALPEGHVFWKVQNKINSYLLTKTVLSLATGILTWIILSMLGLNMAFMFGLFAFLLNFIPSIGSAIAMFLPLPVAALQFQNPTMVALCVLLPGSVQLIVGNLIEPRVMGKSLDLHPVTTMLALMIWGFIWGIPGMFLAVPLTVVLAIFLNHAGDDGKRIAGLLAGQL